jgi:hypothetical protein
MKLPNAENAVVDVERLREYGLNPNHPQGNYKASLFQEKLGFGRTDAELLRKKILEAILTEEVIEQEEAAYGRRYVVDFGVKRGIGFVLNRSLIRTVWIIRSNEDFPRLATCFVPRRSA